MGAILVANPGSSSRKYALYNVGEFSLEPKAAINIETSDQGLICTVHVGTATGENYAIDFADVKESALHVEKIMRETGALNEGEIMDAIAIRIVAPGSYFMNDHIIDADRVLTLRIVLPGETQEDLFA